MTEKPILFSGPMVRAILDGKKTMTRRTHRIVAGRLWVKETHCRYGYWQKNGTTKTGKQKYKFTALSDEVRYFDNPPDRVERSKEIIGWFKRPSIFMPRWASRITLEVTGVRVERLQEITEEDAIREGTEPAYLADLRPDGLLRDGPSHAYRAGFHDLWDSINGKTYPWASNPFVWVIEFRRIDAL
jgi:hypothetical protein